MHASKSPGSSSLHRRTTVGDNSGPCNQWPRRWQVLGGVRQQWPWSGQAERGAWSQATQQHIDQEDVSTTQPLNRPAEHNHTQHASPTPSRGPAGKHAHNGSSTNQTPSSDDPAVQRALQFTLEQQHEGRMLSPTDSMDYSDMTEFSSEEDTTSTSYSINNDSRPNTSAYNKSNYEVLRLDSSGRTRKFYVRRRDLLKEYRLQPRDLRRIDPAIDFTKTSPSITIKENVLLMCLGGVRAIVTAEKVLLFEPGNMATRRLVDTIVPHLRNKAAEQQHHQHQHQASGVSSFLGGSGAGSAGSNGTGGSSGSRGGGGIGVAGLDSQNRQLAGASHTEYMARFYAKAKEQGVVRSPPFELEVLEGALIGATGRLDAELAAVTGRVQDLLTRLPVDINPVSLEELRRVKASLVELEDKADNLRETLEELMDDEDELRELNLSSRPRREERRRQRERDRLERELERAREIKEELEEQLEEDDNNNGSHGALGSKTGNGRGVLRGAPRTNGYKRDGGGAGTSDDVGLRPPPGPAHYIDALGEGYASWTAGGKGGTSAAGNGMAAVDGGRAQRLAELRAKFDRERLADLRAKFSWSSSKDAEAAGGAPGSVLPGQPTTQGLEFFGTRRSGSLVVKDREVERAERLERLRTTRASGDDAEKDWISRLEQQLEGSEEDIQEAQEALEEMVEAEEEEAEVEEVEDLLEYYLQRSTATQSEAERLLEGARDLEESIGISLSARRYEVNRLELTLSIGSFAAALGAMVAGIFGMNMKSMLEMSIAGFWGVTAAIVVGCTWVFVAIMKYTRTKRIL